MSGDPDRARALEAERIRPRVRRASVEELIQRLIATLHALYRTDPDRS